VNVEIKEAGDARKIVNVSFDTDEMSEKGKQVCKELSRIANIPGFRKGKAPEQIIRKKFANEITQELSRKVSTAAYEAVLDNKDIKVYSILKVEPGEISTDAPATIEVTVDIESDFELPKYEEFELTINPTDVKDEDMEKEIDSLRDQRASFEEVDRKVAKGDYVKCSYEGMLDDSPVADLLPDKPMYGKQSNTWEEAGQAKGLGIDAIAQAVIGMKKDDKKDVEADFPKDFEVAPLAGKKVMYSLEIHEVREKKAPDAEDENFLKSLKAESLDDLKKKVKDDLLSRKERENIDGKRSQVTQKILEMPDFPLPQQAVEDESKAIFQSNAQRAMQQGAKQEDIEEKRDELWKEAQVQAQARVKITITLGRIAELEKVEVSNEDLAQAASREAMMMRTDPQAYVQELAKDQARINRLRQDVLHDKTLELVASKAKEKVEVTEDKQTD
jgi:trigger factor